MTQRVEIEESRTLEDYAAVAHLAHAVAELREEAERTEPHLAGPWTGLSFMVRLRSRIRWFSRKSSHVI